MNGSKPGASSWPRARWQSPEDRLALVLEIVVVLMIGLVPALAGSVLLPGDVLATSEMSLSRGKHIYDLVNYMTTTVPVLFIMWRSGRAWAYFGITRLHLGMDLLLGIGVCGVTYAAYWVV